MKIYVSKEWDTKNFDSEVDTKGIKIKASEQEIQVLKDAADICDKLRYSFDKLEIFDPKEPEVVYDNLLSIIDLIEDYKIGDKCNE